MSTTTVIDTIHHVFYDTVHTVAYDTLRTVSFDTVKVALDSNYSVQILHEAQQFYSTSFNWLLAIFGAFLTIIAIIFGFKLYHDLKSIDEKIADVAKRTADGMNKKFEQQFDAQNRQSLELSALVKDMQEKIILNWITQGRLAETQKQFYHEFMCYDFALKEIVDHFDKTFAQYGKLAIEKLVEKVAALKDSSRKNKVFESVLSKIKSFEQCLLNAPLDKDSSKAEDERIYILSILSLCTSAKSTFEQMIEER